MAYSTGYTFGFATAICLVCSASLATVSMGLKDRQEANARRDLCENILSSLGLPEDGHDLVGEEIDAVWEEKVELKAISPADGKEMAVTEADINADGTFDHKDLSAARAAVKGTDKAPAFIGVFVRKDNGTVAIPMNGKGLWGPISGYLALDKGHTTVVGSTFFAPKETPGLGAEIVETKFEAQWIDKKIADKAGKTVAIRVPKTSECDETTDPHCVDGISGATITSRGVDAMVSESLALYETYLQRKRGS